MSETDGWKCPMCGRVSHNPNDKDNLYCGVCGFIEPRRSAEVIPMINEGDAWATILYAARAITKPENAHGNTEMMGRHLAALVLAFEDWKRARFNAESLRGMAFVIPKPGDRICDSRGCVKRGQPMSKHISDDHK
jgi:ribosomal protein S27AE